MKKKKNMNEKKKNMKKKNMKKKRKVLCFEDMF